MSKITPLMTSLHEGHKAEERFKCIDDTLKHCEDTKYTALLVYEKEEVEGLPTADVIERSEIDKAIAQIKDLYTEWKILSDDARLESNPYGAVLNVLQRNIGE